MTSHDLSPDIFRAIVDPTRRAILDVLRDRTLSVSEICEHFPMTQGAVSQHLKILAQADLVRATRVGRHRLYEANPLPLTEVFHWLMHYHRFWPKKLDALDRYLERKQKETE